MSEWEHATPSALSPEDVEALWAYINRFSFRPRESFERTLATLDRVSTIRDEAGELRGLVATRFDEPEFEGRRSAVLFIHWAMMDPLHRGRASMLWVFARQVLTYRARRPWRPFYMMLGSTTFKSYLSFARMGVPCWPTRRAEWPARERALRDMIMAEGGDPGWRPEDGVVHRDGQIGFYEGVTHASPDTLEDPDLRFYVEANPGHVKGDMLICMLPVTVSTIVRLYVRMVSRRRRSPAKVELTTAP